VLQFRIFPDGTILKAEKEWKWNGSYFDESIGMFNGVAVVCQEVKQQQVILFTLSQTCFKAENVHVFSWLPLLQIWEGCAYFRGMLG
jgi:hypothetical protein